jgi:hypothetical protein
VKPRRAAFSVLCFSISAAKSSSLICPLLAGLWTWLDWGVPAIQEVYTHYPFTARVNTEHCSGDAQSCCQVFVENASLLVDACRSCGLRSGEPGTDAQIQA